MRSWILAMILVVPGSMALASDGVLEINQTCAEGPGCFPGDEPGFPVRIINSGSYILTSNLVVPALVDGITTRFADESFPNDIRVSLDMNGFAISSTTNCSGTPLICSPTSTMEGYGIIFLATDGGTFLLRNGQIRGMAGAGALCSRSCDASDLQVAHNGIVGVQGDGVFRNIVAFRNGHTGIDIANSGHVEGCKAEGNGHTGFSGPGTFISNVADSNGDRGIDGSGSVLIGNHVRDGLTGIYCFECTAHNNHVAGSTTGIDFLGGAAIYGGNIIKASGANNIANSGGTVQSVPNVCGILTC